MKFTVDTTNKTITIHNSFKFEELERLRRLLPLDWLEYTLNIENYTYTQNPVIWTYGTNTGDQLPPTFTTSGQYKMNFDN